MSHINWVGPVITVIIVLASILSGIRMFTLRTGTGKTFGVAYLVLAGTVVAVAATAGVIFFKREMSQAMAPEK